MRPRTRAGVAGHPIAHSLSPILHRAAYETLGLRGWEYSLHDVTEAEFATFFAGCDDTWAGLSLTMPLKRVVFTHLQHISELAEAVGAVNTVVFGEDGAHGHNTDVKGIVDALAEVGVQSLKGTGVPVILGGGATAASALAALASMGATTIGVLVRTPERSTALLEVAERFGVRVDLRSFADEYAEPGGSTTLLGSEPSLIVSTLPASGALEHVEPLGRRLGAAPGCTLFDVAYDPWPAPLAKYWLRAGSAVADGFSMLVHQAGEQIRLMTGHEAPLGPMRAAGVAELDRRRALGPNLHS